MQEIKLFKAQHEGKEVIGYEIAKERTDFYISNSVLQILDKKSIEEADEIINKMLWIFNNDIKQTLMF